ncbi:MAG: hypothetical protein U1E76_03505 [Planctomycetota bacterium]
MKKGEDNPRYACRTCGVENKVPVVWENETPGVNEAQSASEQ